jgi:hypothetical protein
MENRLVLTVKGSLVGRVLVDGLTEQRRKDNDAPVVFRGYITG